MKQKRFTLRRLAAFFAAFAALMLTALPARAWDETELLKIKEFSIQSRDSVTSLDFTITFDLSYVIDAYGDKEWGIVPITSEYFTCRVQETDFNSDFNSLSVIDIPTDGTDRNFKVGDTFTFHFDENAFVHKDHPYSYSIGAIFKVYEKGSKTACPNTRLSFGGNYMSQDNYKFTVYGKETGHIFFEECSIGDRLIDSAEQATIRFSTPVEPAEGAKVEIRLYSGQSNNFREWTPYENEAPLVCESESVEVDPEDPTKVIVTFPTTDFLRGCPTHMVCWRAGTFRHAGTGEPCRERWVPFGGCKDTKYGFTRTSDNRNTFEYVTLEFNLPEGYTFGPAALTPDVVEVYEGSAVAEEARINQKLYVQSLETFRDRLRVPLWFDKKPGEKYTLHIPAGTVLLYDAEGNPSNLYSNAEVTAKFTTAFAEDVNLPDIVWSPTVHKGRYDYANPVLANPEGVDKVATMYFGIVGDQLEWNGGTYNLYNLSKKYTGGEYLYGSLYEVTEEGDVLLADDVSLGSMSVDNMTGKHMMATAVKNMTYYKGHTYRLVVPAGAYTLQKTKGYSGQSQELYHYVKSPEFVFTFKGATPDPDDPAPIDPDPTDPDNPDNPEDPTDPTDPSGIEGIAADAVVEVWNLQGVSLGCRQASSLRELPSGCYIVRAGGKTVKVRLK